MANLGYARVSTNQQDLTIQIKALVGAGVKDHPDYLFTDKASGKTADRTGLQLMLTKAREGDHVIVKKLDRLGRNTADMIGIIHGLHARGISIQFMDDGISTEGTMGRMVVTILAAVAEAERERILERTNEGRRAAVQRGVKMGRKPKLPDTAIDNIRIDISTGMSKTAVAHKYGISRQTLYNLFACQPTSQEALQDT